MADLFPCRLVVLDTETTGFASDPDSRVVELGGVIVNCDGTLGDRWQSLVRPDIFDAARSAGAIAIHGITPEMVRSEPTTHMAAGTFRGWLRHNGIQFVTSFNVGFDRPMVERMGLTELRWASCVMLRAFEDMKTANACTLNKFGKPKWPSLAEASAYYGVPVEGRAHRVEADAVQAAGVCVEIKRRELARSAA